MSSLQKAAQDIVDVYFDGVVPVSRHHYIALRDALENDAIDEMQRLTERSLASIKRLEALTETHRELDEALNEINDNYLKWEAAVAAEREACAQLVESYTGAWDDEGYALSEAIRARGQEPKIGEVYPIFGEQVTWRQALGDDPLAR